MPFKPWSSWVCTLQAAGRVLTLSITFEVPAYGFHRWHLANEVAAIWDVISSCHLLCLAADSAGPKAGMAGWDVHPHLGFLCSGLHQQSDSLASDADHWQRWGTDAESEDLPLLKPSGLICKSTMPFWHCRAQRSSAQTRSQLWATRDMPELMQQIGGSSAEDRRVSWLPVQLSICCTHSLALTSLVLYSKVWLFVFGWINCIIHVSKSTCKTSDSYS